MLKASRVSLIPARSFELSLSELWCESQDLLFARDTDYHRRNVFHIDERVEVFRASQIGKMNDVVCYLRDLAAHFLSGSQVQFDTLTRTALKKADDGGVWLEGGFLLSEQIRTGNHCKDDSDNK
jgi:hypothetical protein